MEKALFSLFLFKGFWALLLFGFIVTEASSQYFLSTESYPDEEGYQRRIAGELQRLADQPMEFRSQSSSNCPDTGFSFKTWALEGDVIYSPFTGRAFIKGSTGYFGPKKRSEDGRISHFGGDALKKDLLPILAKLLINPEDSILRAFVSIPGNLHQQYHFAAKNWARFYPLLADEMGEEWKSEFQRAVANYSAAERPSDGFRKYDPLSIPHTLVGEPGMLLGGNKKDGGTENHKVMWRSSAWVYAMYFPQDALISQVPAAEVQKLSVAYFTDFYEKILHSGNGEYDSEIYYPHSIEGLLNIYDFAKDQSAKAWAKAILDYLLATIAIKSYDGALAGAQKRGSNQMNSGGELNKMFHFWFGSTDEDPEHLASIHQITSTYRPSKYIWDLFHKSFYTPFEMKVTRPSYHMDSPNHAQEYFYGSKSFGLGSVYLTELDNPNQQVQWSLTIKSSGGPETIGGTQPYHRSPGGHSPYTQTMQYKNVILVAAANTNQTGGLAESQYMSRISLGKNLLADLPFPPMEDTLAMKAWFQKAKQQEATWLFLPKDLRSISEREGKIFIETENAYLAVSPFDADHYWMESKEHQTFPKGSLKILEDYRVLVVEGAFSGYALEVVERDEFISFIQFQDEIFQTTALEVNASLGRVTYSSLNSDIMEMRYNSSGLRASGQINGQPISYDYWSPSGVYSSDILSVGDGMFSGKIGHDSFSLRVTDKKLINE